ncbi:hypothetical protein Bbelb_366040 [Branchiostoma belcheri]|nr:hypothetical protein Bbelb_366040 [Branchiostoma belcheri]
MRRHNKTLRPGHTGRTLLERSFNANVWSRSDTSIPTPNQSSLPTWIAASTPDTVPATPCPLVKRLQPLQRSLCNVCATFNRRPGNAGEAAVLKTFGAVGGPLQKRQRWLGVHGVALTVANFCLAVVSGFERNAPAKFRQCDRAFKTYSFRHLTQNRVSNSISGRTDEVIHAELWLTEKR